MILLVSHASSSNSAVIYSGLIAALVSGVVSLIGYSITAYFQNKNTKESLKVQRKNNEATIQTQREIAQMQKDEKLFYQSQLDWWNETRKLIAKFVRNCTIINRKIEKTKKNTSSERLNNIKSIEDAKKQIAENQNDIQELEKSINDIQEQITLIRLYLFHDENTAEREILLKILVMEKHYSKLEPIPSVELSNFVDLVRNFFELQLKELQNKTA
ncbi:hypothetical protein [Limosilactobacillus caccae]|uniref:hypothetical protein n=1 Tax=Limosilactobacillus caccae TaxID=1926284 RepID=UPI000970850F|nr:hypothetical protein [Limosilactobacillus caccae]